MDEIRCKVEVREDEDRLSPGRIVGTLLRYGEVASDRKELFEAGALSWPDGGIVLNRQHSRKSPVMRILPAVVGDRVVIDAALPDTTAGRDIAAEMRADPPLFTGLSIEFRASRQRFENGVRKIAKAVLSAAAIVDSPSYSGSAVEVRHDQKRRVVWL